MSSLVGHTASRLDVEDISVTFGGLRALDGVSFTVEPGSLHAVIGPNGAGKSTLFNVLSGIYRPTTGRVRFGEIILTDLPPHRICSLGIARCFQNIGLFADVSVMDNLLIGRHHLMSGGFISGGLNLPATRREERRHRERVREIASFLGIESLLETRVGELSYGARKRTEIARAVCMEPTLLMLDEPVAGMNRRESDDIAQAIRLVRTALETSVLLVEHDMEFVMTLADCVTVLNFGRRIASDIPSRIQRDPEVIRAYLGDEVVDAATRVG